MLAVGARIVLKPYTELCKLRKVSLNNDIFHRHYDYIKSKEPLTIQRVIMPEDIVYSDETDNPQDVGKHPTEVLYNIYTPRSKLYLFSDNEVELYKEES